MSPLTLLERGILASASGDCDNKWTVSWQGQRIHQWRKNNYKEHMQRRTGSQQPSLYSHGCCRGWCEKVLFPEKLSDASVRGLRHQEEAFWKQLHHHHEALKAAESVKGKLYLEMKTTKRFGACRWILQEGGWGGEARCNGTAQIPGWPRLLQRLCIWAQKWELLNAAHHATI